MRQTQRYRYWNYLVGSGLFVKSRHSQSTLILAKRGRAELDGTARPARSHFYVEHDALVARFFMSLEKRGLIVNSWIEDELMRNPIEAYNILGMPQIQRLPDLIFDFKRADNSTIRCALEIERVTKSQSRYAKISLAYLNASKVDIVLFGCAHPSTQRAIRNAFNTEAHIESKRVPGTYLFEEFDPFTLSTNVTFHDVIMNFEKFIKVVTKLPVPQMEITAEKEGNALPPRVGEKQEAA